MQISQNIDSTDTARIIALKQKAAASGLQESEKEELKNLLEKAKRAK